MIVALGQFASLGIRDRAVRLATWVGTSGVAAVFAAASAAAAVIPYVLLCSFALWRLTGPR